MLLFHTDDTAATLRQVEKQYATTRLRGFEGEGDQLQPPTSLAPDQSRPLPAANEVRPRELKFVG